MRNRWSACTPVRGCALVLVSAALAAACGDDSGTAPVATAPVRAYVTDEPASPSGGTAPSRVDGPTGSTQGSGDYTGTLEGDAQVFIAGEGGVWVELGPPSAVTLDLRMSGHRIELHGEATVPVGIYTRVRLILTGAHARISTGSTIGGISLATSVTMRIGAHGTVVIEKQVPPFEVRAGKRTAIGWDLNSELWVSEDNMRDEHVDEAEVEEASEPWVEEEPGDGHMR
jgi:hypothetical protein